MQKSGLQIELSTYFRASLNPKQFSPTKVWPCLREFIEKHDMTTQPLKMHYNVKARSEYDLGDSVTVSFGDVEEFLLNDKGVPSLSLSSFLSDENSYEFSLNASSGRINLSSQKPIIADQWQILVKTLSDNFELRNALVQTSHFLDQVRAIYSNGNLPKILWGERNPQYCRSIAAEMWFGDAFWQYASCNKEDILNADWLKVEDGETHLHVVAWPEPFNSTEGEQGEIQKRLAKLLFGIQ